MKQIIDYSNYSEREAFDKAIEDCRFYLGDHFEKVTQILIDGIREHGDSEENRVAAKFNLCFVGIEGFAADKLYDYCVIESGKPDENGSEKLEIKN